MSKTRRLKRQPQGTDMPKAVGKTVKVGKDKYSTQLSYDAVDQHRSDVTLGAVGINIPLVGVTGVVNSKDALSTFEGRNETLNFGWAGNDPKFYGDTTLDSVIPKPEDFVEIPFRLLSAAIVGAGTWKATDFSNIAMLRKSRNMLNAKPVYKDHETDLDNWVGLINGVKWSAETTQGNVKVPAGIDGILAIDAKTNPKVARGALMGSVFSNSVTVSFDWEMSHPFENEWDFYNKVGDIGSDGKMIRRIATKIHDYYESSLVWLGADPFAKARDGNGDLTHIDVSNIQELSRAGIKPDTKTVAKESDVLQELLKGTGNKNFTINFAIDKNVVSLINTKKNISVNKNNNDMNDKFLAAFVAVFGASLGLADDAKIESVADFTALLKKINNVSQADLDLSQTNAAVMGKVGELALATLKATDAKVTEVTDVTSFMEDHIFIAKTALTEFEGDKAKLAKLEPEAKLGRESVDGMRKEAVRLYKVAVGYDNSSESVIKLMNEAEPDALKGLLDQYVKGAVAKFTATCQECGSHEFEFKSSIAPNPEDTTVSVENIAMTYADFRDAHDKPSMSIGQAD